jgi:hypothetical protein
MVKVDNEEKARKAFARLFERPECEGPNETELEIRAFEAAQEDAARSLAKAQGKIIRVFKKDAQKPVARRRGWLLKEMREAR